MRFNPFTLLHSAKTRELFIKKQLLILFAALLFTTPVFGQKRRDHPEKEMALTIKATTGKIIYGANKFYITDPGSICLLPGIRYDQPVRLYTRQSVPHFVSITGEGGFLFCKAKEFDSIYFRARNPTYFTLSAGIYTVSAISVGTEIFFWKGLGNRDAWGAKFISLGYNGYNFRFHVAGLYYTQLKNTSKNGLLFSAEFFLKLVKE